MSGTAFESAYHLGNVAARLRCAGVHDDAMHVEEAAKNLRRLYAMIDLHPEDIAKSTRAEVLQQDSQSRSWFWLLSFLSGQAIYRLGFEAGWEKRGAHPTGGSAI